MMPDNLVWCRRCRLVKPIVKEDVHTPIFLFPKNSQVAKLVDAKCCEVIGEQLIILQYRFESCPDY